MCSEATTKFFSYVDTIQQITFSKDGTRMYFLAAPEKHPVGLYCVPIDVERTGGTSMVGVVCCLFVTALFICLYLSLISFINHIHHFDSFSSQWLLLFVVYLIVTTLFIHLHIQLYHLLVSSTMSNVLFNGWYCLLFICHELLHFNIFSSIFSFYLIFVL